MKVRAGGVEANIFSSYTPRDCVADLASAVALMINGGTDAEVAFFEEPPVVELLFTADNDDAMVVVTRHRTYQKTQNGASELLRVRGSRAEVCLPFWRGLRKLQSLMPPNEYESAWRHGFPSEKVDEIAALVRSNHANPRDGAPR